MRDYEFLRGRASHSGATFPLSRASLSEKLYAHPRRPWARGEPGRKLPASLSRPRDDMQKSVRYNEGHALFLSAAARKEGTKRGYLSKKTAENSRWHEKFFALYQNILFYFENEQSARPAGIYLLEGCTCERVPAPKMSTAGKEALEKQVRFKDGTKFKYTKPCCQVTPQLTTVAYSEHTVTYGLVRRKITNDITGFWMI